MSVIDDSQSEIFELNNPGAPPSLPIAVAAAVLPAGTEVGGKASLLQRRVALMVLVLPAVALGAALAIAFRRGITAVDVCLFAGMYLLTMFGITAGFHRHFAHRAFRTSPAFRKVLAALGSMCAQGPLLFWVTAHRRHHAYSDGPGDPHSPNLVSEGRLRRLRGFWHAHMGWMLDEDISDWSRFTRDLLKDRSVLRMHETYPLWLLLGLALPAAIGGLVTLTWWGALTGFLWGGLVRIFFVNHAAWCVGSVCHMTGRRSFPTPDKSGNVPWVAVITFGEGMQNNHHAFPSSAYHGLRWREPDLSGWIIRGLARFGLLWDVKFPSPAVREAARYRDYVGLDPRQQNII